MMRILLVEDDRAAARGVAFQLRQTRIVVDIADCGNEAIELAKIYDYDGIILDLLLPDMEGYSVIKKIRSLKIKIPILILSSISKTQSKILGLEAGADDYMSKPFESDELIARIHAMIRRSNGLVQSKIKIGNIELNLKSKELTVLGRDLHLTSKEYAIFELLLLRKGNIISKENFLDHLYGGIDEPDSKIIDVFICKIRKKFYVAGCPDLIGTVWGRGYIIRENYSEIKNKSLSAEI
jgi:two-component system cell cycle response regulator CtrA